MKLKSKEVFLESPGEGILVYGNTFYVRRDGVEKVCYRSTITRSDTLDTFQRCFSGDNGLTWSEPEPIEFTFKTSEGTRRTYAQPGFIDPANDRLLTMVLEGVLPSDDPMEGMTNWYPQYRLSTDGGRTNCVDEQVIQRGYSPDHPFECVWVGKNSMMIGDITCRPIRTRQGRILVPVAIAPLGPDGECYNPGGGYTYHEAAVLIGAWIDECRIEWDISQIVANDPTKSTRGCDEPTIAEMPDGRILMVIRGSNDVKPDLPCYKWYSVSEDGGYTWSQVRPWTYTDGANFFSPASCSQLLQHSNGRYYWIGNITQGNPRGNRPRYPMTIGEVDPESLMLIKDTVITIDDRQEGEDEATMLSNFMAHEDRQTSDIIVHMSRPFTRSKHDWTGHAYLYRIEP